MFELSTRKMQRKAASNLEIALCNSHIYVQVLLTHYHFTTNRSSNGAYGVQAIKSPQRPDTLIIEGASKLSSLNIPTIYLQRATAFAWRCSRSATELTYDTRPIYPEVRSPRASRPGYPPVAGHRNSALEDRRLSALEIFDARAPRVVRLHADRMDGREAGRLAASTQNADGYPAGARQFLSTLRVLLIGKREGRTTLQDMCMALAAVNGFSPYSPNLSAALALLDELDRLPPPGDGAEQLFVNYTMAAALSRAGEATRRLGVGQGLRSDAQGLEVCARAIVAVACKTTAPFACRVAACALRVDGSLAQQELIVAAAAALRGAA